jgi:CRISPR/Cas system-associated exonuclease Cas4 (RecB family)
MERGRAAHQALYVYARTRNLDEALNAVQIERPAGMLPEEEQRYRDLEYATRELVRGYVQQLASREEFEVEAVELPVAARIDEDAYYVGVIDAIVRHPVLGRFVHEYKTTSQIPSDWVARFQIDSQAVGYVWLLRRIGIEVRGAIISILRATKYPDYVREVITIEDWMLDEFEHELRQLVADVRREEVFSKTTSACFAYNQRCPFHKLCCEPPEMRERMIQEGFYTKRAPREHDILQRALGA